MAAEELMRSGMVFGIVAAVGLILQILLGFALAGAETGTLFSGALIAAHMAIGITGLALVAFLLGRAYYSEYKLLRLLYLLVFILVVLQVTLGFRVLAVADEQLLMGHQSLAFGILVLIAAGEFLSARQRRKASGKVQKA